MDVKILKTRGKRHSCRFLYFRAKKTILCRSGAYACCFLYFRVGEYAPLPHRIVTFKYSFIFFTFELKVTILCGSCAYSFIFFTFDLDRRQKPCHYLYFRAKSDDSVWEWCIFLHFLYFRAKSDDSVWEWCILLHFLYFRTRSAAEALSLSLLSN